MNIKECENEDESPNSALISALNLNKNNWSNNSD